MDRNTIILVTNNSDLATALIPVINCVKNSVEELPPSTVLKGIILDQELALQGFTLLS
jgi:hypothetical protein